MLKDEISGYNLVVECHASDLIARVRFPLAAPLSKIVAPDESIEKSTVKVDFFNAFILKKEGLLFRCFYGNIYIIKSLRRK